MLLLHCAYVLVSTPYVVVKAFGSCSFSFINNEVATSLVSVAHELFYRKGVLSPARKKSAAG